MTRRALAPAWSWHQLILGASPPCPWCVPVGDPGYQGFVLWRLGQALLARRGWQRPVAPARPRLPASWGHSRRGTGRSRGAIHDSTEKPNRENRVCSWSLLQEQAQGSGRALGPSRICACRLVKEILGMPATCRLVRAWAKSRKNRGWELFVISLKQGFATRISCSSWLSLSQREALDFQVLFSLSALAKFPLVTAKPLPFLPSASLWSQLPSANRKNTYIYIYLYQLDPVTILYWFKTGELSRDWTITLCLNQCPPQDASGLWLALFLKKTLISTGSKKYFYLPYSFACQYYPLSKAARFLGHCKKT